MLQDWIEELKLSVLFNGIDNQSLNMMLDCLNPKIRRCKQREIIVSYGEMFQGIGVIASGKVALTKETYSGNRIIMGIFNTGDIFGETVAFSDTRVWPATVIAQEDCDLLFLPSDRITGVCANTCASHNTLINNLLRILSNRNLMLSKKIEHISAKNIRGKIGTYLLDICREQNQNTLTIPMKRHELADYLNIPRPSLSREMALMRDAGIIEFEGSNVSIKNILALEKSLQ
jgi:CRP/FNR family transcriptional regulator, dissimilatory nitrate respiration regulator